MAEQAVIGPVANGIGKTVVPAEQATFAITFGYMYVAYSKRRRDVEVTFDIPYEQFGRDFHQSKATVF
ncbi:hypothetical protein MRX96_015484 [Rhipicephalus microplus]